MSRRCELTGVGPMVGHHVSHSNVKSKRRFLPALAPASLQSEALGQTFRLRVSNAALRTVDFRGGLDAFLLGARDETLSLRARKIKRQVKAKQAAAEAAASGPPSPQRCHPGASRSGLIRDRGKRRRPGRSRIFAAGAARPG